MKNFNKLFDVLHVWKPYYLLSAVLLVVATFFRMLEPKVLQITIDGIIFWYQHNGLEDIKITDTLARWLYNLLPTPQPDNLNQLLWWAAIMYLSIALIRSAGTFISSAITAYSTEKATKRLRDNLFAYLQKLPLSFHVTATTGELIQRCTGDVDTVKRFIGTQVVDVVLLSAIFIFSFVMMFSIHAAYAIIAICLTPLIFIQSYLFFKRESKIWEEHEAEQDKLTSIVEENLGGIRVVKAFAQETAENQKFENQNQAKLSIGLRHVQLHANFWPLSDFLYHLQVVVSILAGGFYVLNNALTIGELSAFYSYIVMVGWPVRNIGRVISQLSMSLVAVERIATITDAPAEEYTGITGTKVQGNIAFKNVWFKYPGSDEYVLKDVSFKVQSGQKIALMGPTGSGKSTIIALLSRFYEPDKGEILLDNVPLTQYNKQFLRSRIGVVLQKPFLFSTTIKRNIAYTNLHTPEEKLIEASTAASIHDIIHIFPQGYDTMVGEKGVSLSGGQKQRVTLARTLLETPDILVLDDATSAVDTETEYDIQQALERYIEQKTVFIIAHRVTAVQHTDKILVMQKGEVAHFDSPENLLQQEGYYRQIYQVQATLENEILN
ncbi:MAG TPA: ABC transporter ATP-binding protein [Chitinophagales bacterium]|nr:ABC transporter ATP-binding protein [Chitinophagales bacterium]